MALAGKQRREASETFEIETPHSHFQCTVRRVSPADMVTAGVMPSSLSAKVASLQTKSKKEAEQFFAELSPKEQDDLQVSTAYVIRSMMVSPEIVESPTSNDQVTFVELVESVGSDDINWLVRYALGGGGESEALENFR